MPEAVDCSVSDKCVRVYACYVGSHFDTCAQTASCAYSHGDPAHIQPGTKREVRGLMSGPKGLDLCKAVRHQSDHGMPLPPWLAV
jgi:hypothetical protein